MMLQQNQNVSQQNQVIVNTCNIGSDVHSMFHFHSLAHIPQSSFLIQNHKINWQHLQSLESPPIKPLRQPTLDQQQLPKTPPTQQLHREQQYPSQQPAYEGFVQKKIDLDQEALNQMMVQQNQKFSQQNQVIVNTRNIGSDVHSMFYFHSLALISDSKP